MPTPILCSKISPPEASAAGHRPAPQRSCRQPSGWLRLLPILTVRTRRVFLTASGGICTLALKMSPLKSPFHFRPVALS